MTEAVSASDTPVLDESHLLAQFGEDPAILNELRDLFLLQIPQHMDAIRSAYEASNCQVLARAAHSLKGAAATYGAMRLTAASRKVELLAKDGRLAEVDKEIKTLAAELAQVIALIENLDAPVA